MKRVVSLIAFALLSAATSVAQEIRTEQVSYKDGDITLKGYLALPAERTTEVPGVLVVHEWWGLNDHARNRAEALARMGYAAFALDMYGDGATADHPQKAKEFTAKFHEDKDLLLRRFEAGLNYLKSHPAVDNGKISAIGYCFGGGTVLEVARRGLELRGVASFHGTLAPAGEPAKPGAVKAAVLVLHGGADEFIEESSVGAFVSEMENAGAYYEFVSYPGAQHSFTNPSADKTAEQFKMAISYNREAAEDSWKQLEQFLKRVFR